MPPTAPSDIPVALSGVYSSIVSCERCSAPEDVLPTSRAGEEARVPARHLLGPAGAGLRRSGGAAAADRPRAGGARREPDRPHVHRRRDWRLRRLPDVGAARGTASRTSPTSTHRDDGLRLADAYILSAVRCAPPDNKPLPEEIPRCQDHLDAELAQLPNVRVVVALGKIAFDAWLQRLRRQGVGISPKPQFGHGVVVPGAPDADWLLSPEPSEHQYWQADGRDDGERLQTSAADAGVGGLMRS